jgi:toxin ParE1/3/4
VVRLTFAPKALQDLQDIGDFVAQDNPSRAITFVKEMVGHCTKLASAPEAYPVLADLDPGIRRAVHGAYLILFRLMGDELRVVRILHGSRLLRFGDL